MKHLSIGIIFATLLATVFISCREGKQGEPGPSGISSPLLPYKSGSITGVLQGVTRNDSAFTLPLNYQYFKGTSDNAVSPLTDQSGDYNVYSITRYDSTGDSYIKFNFLLNYMDNSVAIATDNGNVSRTTAIIPTIYNSKITIVTNQKLSTNNMFYFGTTTDYYNPFNVSAITISDVSSGNSSNLTYSNIVVNSTTGLISFDYSLELSIYDNSTRKPVYMIGTVSLNPYNVAYREGAE